MRDLVLVCLVFVQFYGLCCYSKEFKILSWSFHFCLSINGYFMDVLGRIIYLH